jgi:hypothetical protein
LGAVGHRFNFFKFNVFDIRTYLTLQVATFLTI